MMRRQNRLTAAGCTLLSLLAIAPASLADTKGAVSAAPTATKDSGLAPAATAAADSGTAPAGTTSSDDTPKMMFKPGETISIDTNTEDITPTYDVELAQKQAAAYPDSPEASFILAVALTRTSRVEEALKEVQHARKQAESKGGPAYFDKMIATYEKMLTAYPDDNAVRYGLAWAYYMKAYLLSRQSRRTAAFKAANPQLAAAVEAQQKQQLAASGEPTVENEAAVNGSGLAPTATKAADKKNNKKLATKPGVNNGDIVKALTGSPAAAAATLGALAAATSTGKKPALDSIPHIPGALEKVDPLDVPRIRSYFEKSLAKIDEILQREPNDVWSIVYGAHLRAEYTGDLNHAMKVWKVVAQKYPNNPAPFFFLGEGYLKEGNLKESINNVSRALFLRAM